MVNSETSKCLIIFHPFFIRREEKENKSDQTSVHVNCLIQFFTFSSEGFLFSVHINNKSLRFLLVDWFLTDKMVLRKHSRIIF